MKVKLIKDHDEYMLIDDERLVIATTDESMLEVTDKMKLSKQNCDEIFGVVDVEKLAEYSVQEVTESNADFYLRDVYKEFFKEGFNKAIELNKDKVFTLGDIKEVIKKARLLARLKEDYGYDEYMFDEEDIIQSIQQPTEIEVVIEMECPQCQEWGYVSKCRKDCNKKFLQPKLDSNGCLILKKI
jgi:hypothetical protein